jgi:tetratricopeptide (TPR) repeat protein
MKEAFSRLQGEDYDGALSLLQPIVLEEPDNWNALYLTGHCYREKGDLQSSVSYFERATSIDRCAPFVWTSLGVSLQLLSNFDQSVSAFNTSIEMKPDDFDSRNSLGMTYKEMGELEKALASYEVAQQILCDEAYKLAKDQGMAGSSVSPNGEKVYKLEADFMGFVENWLKRDVRYSIVMNNIGGVYLELGGREQARDAFFESIDMTPKDTSYRPPYYGLEVLGIAAR